MKNLLLILGAICVFFVISCSKRKGICRCVNGYTGVVDEHETDDYKSCQALTQRAYSNNYPYKCTFIPE